MMHCCDQCGTIFTRKSSLRRHEKDRCAHGRASSITYNAKPVNMDISKRLEGSDYHKFDTFPKEEMQITTTTLPTLSEPKRKNVKIEAMKKNPKVQALLDAVINDGIPVNKRLDEPILKIAPSFNEPMFSSIPPLQETIVLLEKPIVIPDYKEIEKPFDDESDSEDEIDISDLPPPSVVNFLSETVNGLRARFEELIKKVSITRKSGEKEKTGDRNELVFLLDELKHQGGIGQRSYQGYNDYLADSPPDLENEDSEENEKIYVRTVTRNSLHVLFSNDM